MPSGPNIDTGASGGSGPVAGSRKKIGDVDAEIGDLTFYPEFSDPDVNLSHSRDTNDHEIVTGHTAYRDQGVEYVVQAMGRNAPEIDITGWITEEQLEVADELVTESRVRLVTSRWQGAAVPLNVDVDYSRVYHDKRGPIFETTFDLLGTNPNQFPKDYEDDLPRREPSDRTVQSSPYQ